jgi:Domain of unknown function (DUF4349)
MDRSEDDTLFAELRELRPTPRPEFTADLDERAAAGFPRRSTRAPKTPFARLVDRWRAMSPRRRLIPALGFALTILVVATVVVASVGSKGGSVAEQLSTSASESGATTIHRNGNIHTLPPRPESFSAEEGAEEAGGVEESAEAEAAGAEAFEEPPEVENGKLAKGAEHAGEKGAGFPAIEAQQNLPNVVVVGGGENAKSGSRNRDIERSASVVLGTKPGEVAGAAANVYKAVHEVDGVVLRSSVESGRTGPTGASFSLLIPSSKLDDALANFSQIAEVRSRHDATDDITAPTVGAAEELADSNASIEGLLKELGDVETESERESVEARLREARRQHAAIRTSLDHLHKRASTSEVSVRIVTDHGASVTPGGSGSGSWGIGDALHDAGHILTIAAGVVLIALAVLAPIFLILLLIWLGNRFRIRRLRERTLG